MILDCPSCTTRFAIHDDAFAAGARRVRCAKCQHVWAVGKMEDSPPAIATVPLAVTENFAEVLAATPSDAVSGTGLDDIAPSWMDNLGSLTRQLSFTSGQAKFVSLVLLAAILILCGVARHSLAARSPTLAGIFAFFSIRHETAQNQLDIQLTRAEKCLVAGRDMLCIEGTVTHKGQETLVVPPIYVTALNVDGKEFADADGHIILTWTIASETENLLPGGIRRFSLTEPYPDQAITDFDYGFTDDAHESRH